MKRCQKCNFQNDALIDYCWQCGSQLPNFSEAGNYYQSAQATQAFQSETPTQIGAKFNNSYQNNFTQNYQPSARPANYKRIFTILGGIFALFLLFSAAGAATAYKVFYKPTPKPIAPQPIAVKEEPVNTNPVKQEETTKTEPAKETDTVKINPTDKKSDKTVKPKNSSSPRVEFEKMWVDYNVKEEGRLGMRIHVKFEVWNMKDVDSYLAIYFEKEDGTKLRTKNKTFSSNNGQVAVFRSLKPGYDDTVYKDLELFMPYDEFKLGRGKYNLKMDADLIYENGDLVEHLNYLDFLYEKF